MQWYCKKKLDISLLSFTQDVPVSKYMLTTMAQLVMATGQLEKLQKTGMYVKNLYKCDTSADILLKVQAMSKMFARIIDQNHE